jgi:hypothetical protein
MISIPQHCVRYGHISKGDMAFPPPPERGGLHARIFMNQAESPQPQLNRIQLGSLVVGVIGLGLCVVGWLISPTQFFQSYLFAYLFWIGLALGCLAIMMLQYLGGGAWGLVVRRLLEAGALTLPLMALLFVPLVFGIHELYIWARPEVVAADELLQGKSLYLNVPFFLARTAIYFAVWIGFMYILNRWSRRQDRTGDPWLLRRLRLFSAIGLVLYFLTMTFAAFDWAMSLEPHWFSTIYGVIFIIGQGLSSFSFVIVVAALLADRQPLADVIRPQHFHDLGNLLLAFVMLWAYMQFSQFLIIWSGNIPEEVPWYLHRMQGGWEWIALFLIIFHFTLPFFLLLPRATKRRGQVLARVAVALIFVHLIAVFWIVVPSFHETGLQIHWLDVTAAIGIGGIWIAVFVWQLKGRPLIPPHDPRLQEVAGHGH